MGGTRSRFRCSPSPPSSWRDSGPRGTRSVSIEIKSVVSSSNERFRLPGPIAWRNGSSCHGREGSPDRVGAAPTMGSLALPTGSAIGVDSRTNSRKNWVFWPGITSAVSQKGRLRRKGIHEWLKTETEERHKKVIRHGEGKYFSASSRRTRRNNGESEPNGM